MEEIGKGWRRTTDTEGLDSSPVTSKPTSINAGVPDPAALTESVGDFLDLLRQFTSRSQDEHDGPVSALKRLLMTDVHHARQQELTGEGDRQ